MATPFNIFDFHKKPKRKKNLMEFRAGKMKMNEDNWVYADKRKGLVFIHQTSDGLMHFCWKDRITGKVEDDLVIFPDETIFKRLPQCNTGRVFLLKFKNSKKLFLWMQEPKEDNDIELCKKVNELLNPKSKTTASNGSKVVNMNDLTELLGELNEIGALNDIDLLELLAQGFGSQVSNESDLSPNNPTQNQTAPFPIGTTGSYPTDAERQSSILLGPLNHSTKLGISSLETQNTKDGNQSDNKKSVSGISTNDLTNILSDDSIKRLLENQAFRKKVLHTDLEISQETIERMLILNSEENNNLMKTLFEILSNREMSLELIQEMALPETIISAISEYDLTSVLQALEQYFHSLASNPPN